MIRSILGVVALLSVVIAFAFRYQLSQQAYTPVKIPSSLAKGAFHIHTDASHDGRQTREEVMRAARALNLDFIVVTEHNLEEWTLEEIDGLWVIRGPELSLKHGHTVRLINPEEPLDIVAHPGRPRRPRTEALTTEQGIELVNPTVTLEELLYRAPLTLGLSFISYLAEPSLGLLSLLEVDRTALSFLNSKQRRSLWCAVDSHGWLPPRLNLSLWTLSLAVPRHTLSSETLIKALQEGPKGCFTSLLSTSQPIEVSTVENGTWKIQLKASLAYPGSFRLYRDGELITTSSRDSFSYTPKISGNYHVEYWVQARALPLMSRPQLAAFRPLPTTQAPK